MTEPTTDVVVVEPQAVVYHGQLSEQMEYAKALAHAGLLPPSYRKQPANVLLAMEYAKALDIPNMTVIQGVHIVDGKPTASSALVGALVRKAGHRLRIVGDDTKAVCEIVRHDDPEFTFRSEWTIDRARAAGLTGKGTWKQYPASMLKARAITECARDACPEALSGVQYTPEELGDDNPIANGLAAAQTDSGADRPPTTAPTAPPASSGESDDQSAPESDIEDAVVIDDESRSWPLNDGGDRERRSKRMFAMFREHAAGLDRIQRLAFCSDVVGRDITSSEQLNTDEFLTVCDALARLPKDVAS